MVRILRKTLCVAAGLLLAACAEENTRPNPTFNVIPGVNQVTVVDAEPGIEVVLVSPAGKDLLTLVTDKLGQAHFSYIPNEHVVLTTGEGGVLPSYDGTTVRPGDDYSIENRTVTPTDVAANIKVLDVDDVPSTDLYDRQKMHEGLNYIEMRDGITLSATVWLPETTLCGSGPWPTVINYSGYSPSNPDEAPPGAMIATLLMCYASVGVNMRGTGCSGGVYDIFNTAQHADGYDLVEIIARQWFVQHNTVGMVGLSYPGISELYTAYTNPPSLVAITPLSVIEDPWRQAWPGGVYNSGFTQQWIEARDRFAKADSGGWINELIQAGDAQCEANQDLRSQNVNFEAFSQALEAFPDDANDRRLSNLVPRIDVPVFLTGAWQDEQTGSRFATMLDDFDNAPLKRFTMFNGRHPDGYTPLMMTRWAEFLEFYVAKRIPRINPVFRLADSEIFKLIFEIPGLHFETDRFSGYSSYEEALAAYEAEPMVRILFENGFGDTVTEAPHHNFELSFDSWPPQEAVGRTWYFGPEGTLTQDAPAAITAQDTGIDKYRHDAEAGPISWLKKDSIYRVQWLWEPAGPEYALAYMAAPFQQDTIILGNGGYATLWFATSAEEAHIEVSILEVRPDGTEFLVQSGVFNPVHRNGKDEERSGEFLVEYTYAPEDMAPVPQNEFFEVSVPIRPFGHAFRKGSRLRVVIDTPGRDSAFWEYTNPDYANPDNVIHSIARNPNKPSSLTLPVLTGYDIPAEAPPCYSMRGIACRDWLALPNTAVTE